MNPETQLLVEYLDAFDAVQPAQLALDKARNLEAALARTIFESGDTYDREVTLMVATDRGIEIDGDGATFEEYHWPDSPIKVRKLKEASAPLIVSQLLATGGYV